MSTWSSHLSMNQSSIKYLIFRNRLGAKALGRAPPIRSQIDAIRKLNHHIHAVEQFVHRVNLIRHKQNRMLCLSKLITHKISQSWEFMLFSFLFPFDCRPDTIRNFSVEHSLARTRLWQTERRVQRGAAEFRKILCVIKPLIFYKRRNSNRDWNEVFEQTK